MSFVKDKDTFFASQDIVEKMNNKYLEPDYSLLTLEINKIEYVVNTLRKSLSGYCIEILIDSINIADVILENFDIVRIKNLNKVLKEINTNSYNLKYKIIKDTDSYKACLKFKIRKENNYGI